MRIPLPDDQWADLKDSPDALTGEDEAVVRSAMVLTGEGSEGKFSGTAAGTALMEFAMIARVVTTWSLQLPVTAESVRGLTLRQLRPLRKAIEPFMLELREDADPNS